MAKDKTPTARNGDIRRWLAVDRIDDLGARYEQSIRSVVVNCVATALEALEVEHHGD
jgi:hypothetical protein